MKSHTHLTHLTEEFDSLVIKSMHDWHVPGLAIAVIRGITIDAKVGAFVLVPSSNTAHSL